MLAVVFTLLIAVSGSFSAGGKQASAEGVWEESGLKGEYSLNETLSVPERCFVIAGQNIKAETTVRFPDGNSTKNQTIPLNVTGVYTVFYTAVYDGKIYSRTETFRVNEGLYSFSSEKSSAAYGKYQYAQNKSGLLVRLAEGDVMRFNTPIDVENTTLSDILVEVFATPDNKGASDFEQFEFTFTDVANPDIYLTITALQSAENIGYPLTYCLAGGNGQPLEGIEHSKNTVHINNEWGTVGVHSFSLAYNGRYDIPEYTDNYPDNYTLRFSYDAEENATYVNGAFMIKFDSPEYYDTLWNGFQSGKVFLSVKAGNYNSQTANFCIVDVKGMDLTAASSVDTDPPVIVVDNEYETMPAAVCGGSYPVPKANANDLYCGAAELKIGVFFNYDSSNYINVNIEDGRFETAREGDYAIVYEATDRFGNKSKTVLYVKCISDLPMPEISVPDFETELFAGEFLKIPEYTAKSYSGTADVKIVLSVGGREIDVSERVLIESVEETKLIFRVTDYIGRTSEKSFEIQVKANPLPVFVDEIELPDVFVSGSEYIFPQYYANDYSGENMVRKETYAEITDSDGTTLVHAGDTFTPTVEKNGETVKVVLKCDEASFELNIPTIVPFVEEDGRPRLHLENYLLQNGVVYEKFTDHIVVTANANDGNWKFAKEILAQNASVKFAGIADKNDFGGLLIDFMDYQNPNCKLSVFVSESAMRNWERFAENFLNHVNPHTGLAWKDDPSILSISLVNENTIDAAYRDAPITHSIYAERFEQYCRENSLIVTSMNRERLWHRFLLDLQHRAYRRQHGFLRRLGVKALLTDQNYCSSRFATLLREPFDLVETHSYWNHPRFIAGGWAPPSMVDNRSAITMFGGNFLNCAADRLFGKPFSLSEWDFCNPYDYAAEGAFLVGAYGALQNWNMVCRFDYTTWGSAMDREETVLDYFDIVNDPVRLLSERAGALFFARGDVAASQLKLPLLIDKKEMLERDSWRKDYPEDLRKMALICQVGSVITTKGRAVPEIGNVDATLQAGMLPPGSYDRVAQRFTSSTGELILNAKQGTFQVITPRSEAALLPEGKRSAGNCLSVSNRHGFGAFLAAAMDDAELRSSRRILLLHLT